MMCPFVRRRRLALELIRLREEPADSLDFLMTAAQSSKEKTHDGRLEV